MIKSNTPIIGFAAYSGTGKTTLLKQLIPTLREKSLRVALIKHAHHNFDVDKPGKDSYELRKAGATPTLIASAMRTVLMIDKETQEEPDLQTLIQYFDKESIDVILVEGFKNECFEKIELHRHSCGHDYIFPQDENIIAIAHDAQIDSCSIPQMNINDIEVIANFICTHLNLQDT